MTKSLRKGTLLAALVVSTHLSIAQSSSILFHSKSIRDGLPDNRVDVITEDQQGYIWCSTLFGICRYDGYGFKTYKLGEKARGVKEIICDSAGRIWCIYDLKLMRYEPTLDNFVVISPPTNDFFSHGVSNILEDGPDRFWVTNRNSGLATIGSDGSVLKSYKLSSAHVNEMLKDASGKLWLGLSDHRIIQFDENASQGVESSPSIRLTDKRITALEMDHQGTLWVGTQEDGLYKYDPKTGHSQQFYSKSATVRNNISNNVVLSLLADGNNIWIGTDGGGLNLYQLEQQEFFSFKKKGDRLFSLADNAVLTLHKGDHNIIWAGTVHGGLSFFQNQLINENIPLEKFDIKYIGEQSWKILEDREGYLWLGTGRDGLRRYDPMTAKVETYQHDPEDPSSLGGNNVLAIFEDSHGQIWIGSQHGPVSLYTPSSNNFKRIHINNFSAFAEDKDGRIWIGGASKVTIIDREGSHYEIETDESSRISGMIKASITTLMRDSQDQMWIGTAAGLGVIDQAGKFTLYKSDDLDSTTISGNYVLSIFEDSDFSIWAGTLGNGLNHYNRRTQRFKRYDQKDGLPANHIRNIWEDDKSNIWMSTNLGLSKLDLNNQISNFNLNDGIYPSSPGLAYPLKSGHIIQGGIQGLNIFDPKNLQRNDQPSKIIFTSIGIRGKEAKKLPITQLSKTNTGIPYVEIDQAEANFTVNFLTFNYLSPDKNQYAYKVSQLDNTWHNIGNQKNISFSYLPAGTYDLQIKGANEHGTWSQDIQLRFKVLPRLWEKPLVKGLFGLALVGVVLLLYKWRLHTVRNQRKRLQRQVAMKTEELKKKQAEVLEQNTKLMESEKVNSKLKQKQLEDELEFKISELTNRTLRSVHKNKLLTDIKNELSKAIKQRNINQDNFKSLLSQINDTLTFDSSWDDFYQLFDQVHVSFIQKLKRLSPELTERDVRLCALIKLNFSSQDIATIFGISLNSVKVSKYRLRQKLKMNPDTKFQDYFNL